jgi:hypothetical protein
MAWLIPADWDVPPVFAERLGDAAGRQRAMSADGHLLLILHQPPGVGEPDRRCRLFWRHPDGSWRSNSLGDDVQALRRHLTEFADRVEKLEKEWQSARTAQDYYLLLLAVAPLHRTSRNLHATLQQAREAVPSDRDLINFRDRAGEIERSLELLHGDAKNGLDFMVAYQSELQSHRMYEMAVSAHRLNLLAAVFFPIATLAAVFGMNLAHGLDVETGGTVVFWIILLLGGMAGSLLAWAIAQKPPPVSSPAPRIRKRG